MKRQDHSTGPQKYGIYCNILFVEDLQLSKQKFWENGTETDKNYGLAIQDLISNLLPPKGPKNQKRYLCHGLYKKSKTKTCDFICRVNEIVKYIDHFPPFGDYQGLPEDEILNIMEFALPQECQKEILVQGFDSSI